MTSDDAGISSKSIAAWRVALVWATVSALAAAAMAPYLLALLPPSPQPLPPLPVLMAALSIQTGVLAFLLGWLGTLAGRKIGLGSPLLESLLRGERPELSRSLAHAGLWGTLAGLAIWILDTGFAKLMPAPIGGKALPVPSPLQGLLASAYGGITEEVLMRLGLATLLAWVVLRVWPEKRRLALGVGIVGAALLFGAGHLPAAAQIWPITTVVVVRTILLNAVLGVVAGVLYVRRGLEHAMAAHLCADLVLHVIAPMIR